MVDGFDEAWASSVVGQLSRLGVRFAPGLSDSELNEIGRAFGTPVPSELSLFLAAGVPASPKWAAWTAGPEAVLRSTREWIDRAFRFDFEQGQYWHPLFGERPERVDDAVARALAFVEHAPPLFPIYAHRYLSSAPAAGRRAVLSVWQAVDSIFYGNDLADYFAREFKVDRPVWAASELPPVPVWEELFDLFGVGTPASE
jgi:hypothetical protein